MTAPLPLELTLGATLRDKEYAGELSALPEALQRAPAFGYACLGGRPGFSIVISRKWVDQDRTTSQSSKSFGLTEGCDSSSVI